MDLGDILGIAAQKDLAFPDKKNKLHYEEFVKDEKFCILFKSDRFKEATIECSVPYTGKDEERNYLRTHFLSMLYNAAIHGLKRMNHKKHKI